MKHTKHIMKRKLTEEANMFEKKFIGKGGYGHVYQIDEHTAVKKSTNLFQAYLRESTIMSSCSHPNIMSAISLDVKTKKIIMDFAPNTLGGLFEKKQHEYITKYALLWSKQLFAALEFLHRHHIIHRDVKPSNILIMSNDEVKLADFSISKIGCKKYPDDNRHSLNMNFAYTAPELLYPAKTVTDSSDVWSAGIVSVEMFHGKDIIDSVLSRYRCDEIYYHYLKYFGTILEYNEDQRDSESQKFIKNKNLLSTIINANKIPNEIRNAIEFYPQRRSTALQVLQSMDCSNYTNQGTCIELLQRKITPTISRFGNLNWQIYYTLIDWLYDVCDGEQISINTWILCGIILRSYLSITKSTIARSDFQLIGSTCLSLASCIWEKYKLSNRQLVYLANGAYTAYQLKQKQKEIYQDLQYNLVVNPIYLYNTDQYMFALLLLASKSIENSDEPITYQNLIDTAYEVEKNDLSWSLLLMVCEGEKLFENERLNLDRLRNYINNII